MNYTENVFISLINSSNQPKANKALLTGAYGLAESSMGKITGIGKKLLNNQEVTEEKILKLNEIKSILNDKRIEKKTEMLERFCTNIKKIEPTGISPDEKLLETWNTTCNLLWMHITKDKKEM